MEIKELPEMKFVGVQVETTVEDCKKEMPSLWNKFLALFENIKNKVNDKIMYGLCLDGDNNDGKFRYIACSEVTDFEDLPEDMISETTPKSLYAIYTHKGNINKIGETYEFIMKDLPKQNLKHKDVWLELYDERFSEDSDESEVDIYVAID